MTQVNEINMAKWIVALRSGKYRQTTGKLRSAKSGAMCCLGVACEISKLGKWEPATDTDRRVYVVGADEDAETLPQPVADWIFTARADTNPVVGTTDEYGNDTSIDCAQANDDERWKFKKVADALESTYLPGKKAEEILEAASV